MVLWDWVYNIIIDIMFGVRCSLPSSIRICSTFVYIFKRYISYRSLNNRLILIFMGSIIYYCKNAVSTLSRLASAIRNLLFDIFKFVILFSIKELYTKEGYIYFKTGVYTVLGKSIAIWLKVKKCILIVIRKYSFNSLLIFSYKIVYEKVWYVIYT